MYTAQFFMQLGIVSEQWEQFYWEFSIQLLAQTHWVRLFEGINPFLQTRQRGYYEKIHLIQLDIFYVQLWHSDY